MKELFSIRSGLAKYKTKLVLLMFLCSILPLAIISFVGYYSTFKIADSKIIDSVSLTHKQMVQMLNYRFMQMELVCDSAQNSLYKLYLSKDEDISEYVENLVAARSALSTLVDNFNLYHICAFLPSNPFILSEEIMFFPIDELSRFELEQSEFSGLGISSKWLFKENLDFPTIISKGRREEKVILCCQAYEVKEELQYVIFSSLLANSLSDYLSENYERSPIKCYLISSDGNIIASNSRMIKAGKASKLLKTYSEESFYNFHKVYEGEHIIMDTLENGFVFVSEVPLSYIKKNINSVLGVILFPIIFILPITISIIFLVANSLSRKINILSKSVESIKFSHSYISLPKFEKNFRIDVQYQDEIDILAQTYINMVEEINCNIEEILNFSIQEEKLNYQILLYQINPHFLHNTLNSIKSCYANNQRINGERMISYLSKFYRLLLNNKELIPIKDEIEIVSLYLKMEAIPRKGKLSWNIHLEEGIENFLISQFTIQPFIENSIIHGLVHPIEQMHIDIYISYLEDMVEVKIIDNGIGMTNEKVLELLNYIDKPIDMESNHLGINNVKKRIASSRFGPGTVSVNSRYGEGTEFVIVFKQIIDNFNY